MDYSILKYPRTPHLEGSRLQAGDEDLSQIPFKKILGRNIAIEEKIDGANSAISFSSNGTLLLQNRGHYLDGGYRERHYDLLKAWANENKELLYSVLWDRYIMYGEWMYAKHTIFYDALPDYFMEFDIYDREKCVFLDTPSRKILTDKIGIVHSVPLLASGVFKNKEQILSYLGRSKFITDSHIDTLKRVVGNMGFDVDRAVMETENSTLMEGLYIKIEEDGVVKERVKYVRAAFLQCVFDSSSHWQSRPIVPNQLIKKNE